MVSDLEEKIEFDREKIRNSVRLQMPIEITTYTLSRNMEIYIYDILTAFTSSLSMVGNVGPAAGILGPSGNFGCLPDFVKWWYCFAMLAGRLELYTMIMFFLPQYWQR